MSDALTTTSDADATTTTLDALSTSHTADAVAFCPHARCQHLLVCGSYELRKEESPPRRVGQLLLLDTASGALVERQRIDGAGVLDCAWRPAGAADERALLATATSEGFAELHALEADAAGGGARLADAGRAECAGAGLSLMGCAWSRPGAELALSSTAGWLYVCAMAEGGAPRCTRSWQAHELEGWAVAFDEADPAALYSGGDDAVLKRWDLRCDAADGAAVAATNRRAHGAGVCCVSPSPLAPHLVATGSYDEVARLWDSRQLRQPLAEVGCGGGVWRLKWHPSRRELLLGACMHAGFRVLEVAGGAADGDGAPALRVAASYTAHGVGDALGYGADWAHGGGGGSEPLRAATCSFYDRKLHLWTVSV